MNTFTTRNSLLQPASRTAMRYSFLCRRSPRKVAALLTAATIVIGLSLAGSVKARAINHQQPNGVPVGTVISKGGNTPDRKGQFIYENLGCNKCHGSLGEGISTPGEKGGIPRIAATPLAFPDFVQQVRHPKGQMPAFDAAKVSDSDLENIYAYLKSLAAEPKQQEVTKQGDPKLGQHLFTADGCYECHGYLGQGSTQTGGTRLGPPQIPLSAFISYVRQPSSQMPPYTSKVISDQDLALIYSFLQSVPKPPPSKSIPLLNP
jgi:mono/diheme cytochrome c family protein